MSNFSPSNFPTLFKDDWHTTGLGLADAIAQVNRDILFKEYNMLVQCAPRRLDRDKQYFVEEHKGKLSTPVKGLWREKHLARALWNLNGWWSCPNGGQFCLLDYEFPLQKQRSDARLGEIDLIGVTDRGRIMVIELKVRPRDKKRGEPPMKALMQGLRYTAVVQANLAVIAAEAKQCFNVKINTEPPIVQVLAPQAWWRGWLGIHGSTRDTAGDWEPAFTKLAQDIENRLGVSVECVALDDLDDTDITFGPDRKTPQIDRAPALYPVRLGEVLPIGKVLSSHWPGVSAG